MESEARKIFDDVRAFYTNSSQGNLKSSNKLYDLKFIKNMPGPVFDKLGNKLTPEEFAKKATSSNERQAKAQKWDEEKASQNDEGFRTVEDTIFTLNCRQLARECQTRAVQICKEKGLDPAAWVCCFKLSKADHVFCILGKDFKNWTTPLAWYGKAPYNTIMKGSYFAIDPWLNVCCDLTDYPARAKEKFERWRGRGKQLIPNGLLTKIDDEYIDRFLNEQPTFLPAI